jgi:hypothetical protein
MEKVTLDPARDCEEDFSHENDRYFSECCECHETFIGHKWRFICRTCAETPREIEPSKAYVVHEDVRRLARSMRMLLAKKYENLEERQAVAAKIMKEIQAQV